MTNKDILYIAMFFILKHRGKDNPALFDLYELVVDVVDYNRFKVGCLGYFEDIINQIRCRCLPMKHAKTCLEFCRFAEKFAKICK